ncbi:MAG: hypothetical protein AAGF12_31910 [Myxococcota bacterium]
MRVILPCMLLAVAGCSVPDLDLTGKACPCPEPGWRCFEARCVQPLAGYPSCDEGGVYDISAGDTVTCAVECGALYCWGDNSWGQLAQDPDRRPNPAGGDDEIFGFAGSESPVRVGLRNDWAAVAVGYDHVCAIDDQKDTYCWGRNDLGQLGTGSDERLSFVPTIVTSFGNWDRVSTRSSTTCGVRDGIVACWGSDSCGLLGTGTFDGTPLNSPTAIVYDGEDDWADVAVGGNFVCALRGAGELWCWGCNMNGMLARSSFGMGLFSTPEPAATDETFAQLASGQEHGCGLSTSGQTLCWGLNNSGRTGLGLEEGVTSMPTVVGTDYVALDAESFGACGLTPDGRLDCWGQNIDGNVGVGPETVMTFPTPRATVGLPATVVDFSVGRLHTCARSDDSILHCVGLDQDGQLGTGTTARRNLTYEPVLFAGSDTQ